MRKITPPEVGGCVLLFRVYFYGGNSTREFRSGPLVSAVIHQERVSAWLTGLDIPLETRDNNVVVRCVDHRELLSRAVFAALSRDFGGYSGNIPVAEVMSIQKHHRTSRPMMFKKSQVSVKKTVLNTRSRARSDGFDDHRHRVAPAQAQARKAPLGAGALHLVDERGQNARARSADRVTQSHTPATDIELVL